MKPFRNQPFYTLPFFTQALSRSHTVRVWPIGSKASADAAASTTTRTAASTLARTSLIGFVLAFVVSGCSSESGVALTGDSTASPDTDTTANVDIIGQSWDEELEFLEGTSVDVLPRAALDKFAVPAKGRFFSSTTATGIEVGTQTSVDCQSGEVVAGLQGRADTRLESLQVLCVQTNAQGDWVGTPVINGTPLGAATDSTFTSQCPANHAVVGYETDLGNLHPTSLALQCRPLINKNTTDGTIVTLETVGTPTGAITKSQCAAGAVATGLVGFFDTNINRIGLTCFENPAMAGRWSNIMNWPLIAVNSVLRPDGTVLSYGTDTNGNQGAAFNYLIWDPEKGASAEAFTLLDNTLGVDSFCGAATVLPSIGDVLMPGGDARPMGNTNAGIDDAVILGAQASSLTPAASMNKARWYLTSTVLPDGNLLVNGGINGQRAPVNNPEIYTPATDSWQLLPDANFRDFSYFYPRQWVMPDGNVFGLSRNRLFTLSPSGTGSITDLGQLPAYAHGIGTAVMYEPGKILKVGGGGGNGFAATLIDYNGGTPEVRQAASLAESRKSWPEAVIMADGTVMVAGGSFLNNDARTASLGTEVFDPVTETWHQVSANKLGRLYHSSAVLLKDARVLLAGGGAPGPLKNLNAELFTPPYLFNERGNLAERPTIEYAPDRAAYGQRTGLTLSDNSVVSRVTLVKSGSVTHSFNMEQRFLDLAFEQSGNTVEVTFPANARVATPGYYLLFVWNDAGVPAEGNMISLGTEPAPAMPEVPNTPVPEPASNELLANGSFESGQADWSDCDADALTVETSNAATGSKAIKVSSGGCLYQTVPVTPGATYTAMCQAAVGKLDYSSVSIQMLDSSFSELAVAYSSIEGKEYSAYANTIAAPDDAVFASVTLYSEGTARFDDCSLVLVEGSVPEKPVLDPNAINLLSNGDFESGKTNWIDCAAANLTSASSDASGGTGALAVSNAGCIYQEFPVSAGTSYALSCDAKSVGTQYSSISFQLTDSFYKVLDVSVLPVGNSRYQSYDKTLLAPFGSTIGAVTLYSEDTAQFDGCRVTAL